MGVYQIIWTDFPLAPSDNELYRNNKAEGKRGRARTEKYNDFRKEVYDWKLVNHELVTQTRQDLAKLFKNKRLNVHCAFFFKKQRIVNKDGSTRKLDVSNRLKATHDLVAELLFIDDCHIWQGSFSKSITENQDRVVITIEVLNEPSL